MATSLQITCIHKIPRNDRYHAIESVGGLNFRYTQQEAVRMIDTRAASFYVQSGLYRTDVIVGISPQGHRYLKTTSDSVLVDNLLSLPECR